MQSNQKPEKKQDNTNILYALGGIVLGAVGAFFGAKAYENYKQEQSQQSIITSPQTPQESQFIESLCCPITGELINEAAQLNTCGHTFEKQALQNWLNRSQVCPQCRQPATQQNIIKNYALQEILDQQRKK